MTGSLAGTVACLLLAAPAIADGRCTTESFPVDGAPLAVTLCAGAGEAEHIGVSETFARNGATVTRSLDLVTESGTEVTRAIQTVPLDALGSAKQLHLTIAYRGSTATVEHALLIPGAIVLK